MNRIYHRKCNGHIGWYSGQPKKGDPIIPEKYYYLDGTQPVVGKILEEICPHCKDMINNFDDMSYFD